MKEKKYLTQIEKNKIEDQARDLLVNIFKDQDKLWPEGLREKFQIFDPKIAAKFLGLTYMELHEIPTTFNPRNEKQEMAGSLDLQSKTISIATKFSSQIQKFTGAHEIAHWVLHRQSSIGKRALFRDSPIDSKRDAKQAKSLEEQEADHFAACLIMPRKVVIEEFETRFIKQPFQFNEINAWQLSADDHESLVRAERPSFENRHSNSYIREISLAKATSFNRAHFISLADRFGVSVKAMAIRLDELDLIKWP